MVKGYFKVQATITNTGTQSYEAYVNLRVMTPNGQEALGRLVKKGLNPGQSSTIQYLTCVGQDIDPTGADWPSGVHTLKVNLYDSVTSQGNYIGTLPDGWLVFDEATFQLDEAAILDGKQTTKAVM